MQADAAGLESTPTFFVAGRMVLGISTKRLRSAARVGPLAVFSSAPGCAEWIDSHTHLEHEYPFSVDEYFANAPGRSRSRSAPSPVARLVRELAETHADVWFTTGIHPHEARINARGRSDDYYVVDPSQKCGGREIGSTTIMIIRRASQQKAFRRHRAGDGLESNRHPRPRRRDDPLEGSLIIRAGNHPLLLGHEALCRRVPQDRVLHRFRAS